MAKNRSARAHARKSAPVVIVNDPAALEAERNLHDLPTTEEIIAANEGPFEAPDVADKIIDAEALENNPDVVDSTEALTPITEGEMDAIAAGIGPDAVAKLAEERASESEASAQEPAAPESQDTPEGRLLPTIYPTLAEAYAYADNMRLGGRVNYRMVDGGVQILVRKPDGNKSAPVQASPAQGPATRAAPKVRALRAKASAPRPDTRNAVIWGALTRPEGTTHKEVVALMDDFERARGKENLFPTGIGSDWKLFSGRFGYDRKKTQDADGATRYFCFPFAPVESEASEVEVEGIVPASDESASESEPKVESEESAAS